MIITKVSWDLIKMNMFRNRCVWTVQQWLQKHVKEVRNVLKESEKLWPNNKIITTCSKVYLYEMTMNKKLTLIGLINFQLENVWQLFWPVNMTNCYHNKLKQLFGRHLWEKIVSLILDLGLRTKQQKF